MLQPGVDALWLMRFLSRNCMHAYLVSSFDSYGYCCC